MQEDTPVTEEAVEQVSQSFNLVTEKLQGWLDQAVAHLPNAVVALLVILVFGLAARWGRKITRRALSRAMDNEPVVRLLARLTSIVILLLGLFVALGVLELDKTVTSLLAGAGVVGIALAFAFQDLAANLLAGVYMSFRQPFTLGEVVETNGVFGTVQSIDLRSTVIKTPTGEMVLIPNQKIIEEVLTNHTRSQRKRVDLAIGVSYGDDLEKVERVTREAMEGVADRIPDRDVEIFFTGFGGSSIDLVARVWIPYQRNADFHRARSQMIQLVKRAYDANGIDIPFPIRTLDFGIKGGEPLSTMLGERGEA